MTRRILIAAFLLATLAVAFGASTNSFNTRWTNAHDDLLAVQADIPQDKLRARAQEILREIEAK